MRSRATPDWWRLTSRCLHIINIPAPLTEYSLPPSVVVRHRVPWSFVSLAGPLHRRWCFNWRCPHPLPSPGIPSVGPLRPLPRWIRWVKSCPPVSHLSPCICVLHSTLLHDPPYVASPNRCGGGRGPCYPRHILTGYPVTWTCPRRHTPCEGPEILCRGPPPSWPLGSMSLSQLWKGKRRDVGMVLSLQKQWEGIPDRLSMVIALEDYLVLGHNQLHNVSLLVTWLRGISGIHYSNICQESGCHHFCHHRRHCVLLFDCCWCSLIPNTVFDFSEGK